MIRGLFAFLVVSTLSAAGASAAEIVCGRVDEADDWYITLDSKLSMAAFFDNDHYEAMEMTDYRSLESYPPQNLYTFRGQDGKVVDQFVVNTTSMKGALYLDVKRGGKSDRPIAFRCDTVKNGGIDWKEVRQALDDARRNGGSTRF